MLPAGAGSPGSRRRPVYVLDRRFFPRFGLGMDLAQLTQRHPRFQLAAIRPATTTQSPSSSCGGYLDTCRTTPATSRWQPRWRNWPLLATRSGRSSTPFPERLWSVEAKAGWVEPDRQPLDFSPPGFLVVTGPCARRSDTPRSDVTNARTVCRSAASGAGLVPFVCRTSARWRHRRARGGRFDLSAQLPGGSAARPILLIAPPPARMLPSGPFPGDHHCRDGAQVVEHDSPVLQHQLRREVGQFRTEAQVQFPPSGVVPYTFPATTGQTEVRR